MQFTQKIPCNECPFRTDCTSQRLGKEKAREIADTITSDQLFPCHKSIDTGKEEIQCAGALLLAQKKKGIDANWHFRMAKASGQLEEQQLQGSELIFDTIKAMIDHHSKPQE